MALVMRRDSEKDGLHSLQMSIVLECISGIFLSNKTLHFLLTVQTYFITYFITQQSESPLFRILFPTLKINLCPYFHEILPLLCLALPYLNEIPVNVIYIYPILKLIPTEQLIHRRAFSSERHKPCGSSATIQDEKEHNNAPSLLYGHSNADKISSVDVNDIFEITETVCAYSAMAMSG